MFGVDIFGYGGGGTYTSPMIAMKADWADYVVDKPTAYEKCISYDDFADGWVETLSVGDNLIPEDKQNMRAISIPEGYVASLYPPTADGVAETASQEITGPTNEDCLAENFPIAKIVITKLPTCASLNRVKGASDYECGVCDEARKTLTGETIKYVEDTDVNSDTYGECIAVDNTLLYVGIGGAALLLLIVALK
tara:strand:- start:289 stop:870 length:582 start_codon:yes stop_codon:yes gene_type:complete